MIHIFIFLLVHFSLRFIEYHIVLFVFTCIEIFDASACCDVRVVYIAVGGVGSGLLTYTHVQVEQTALMMAARYGHTDCARLLLDAGADKDASVLVRRIGPPRLRIGACVGLIGVSTILRQLYFFLTLISSLFVFMIG